MIPAEPPAAAGDYGDTILEPVLPHRHGHLFDLVHCTYSTPWASLWLDHGGIAKRLVLLRRQSELPQVHRLVVGAELGAGRLDPAGRTGEGRHHALHPDLTKPWVGDRRDGSSLAEMRIVVNILRRI